MKLLAIDTSTEACSAALHADGRIHERFELASQRHAELILPMCDAVLADAGLTLRDLDGLAVGRGPGAFTGVRIAIGVIQGMSLGTALKIACISTLAALALATRREHSATRVITAIDARMSEVYYGAYTFDITGGPRELVPECVCKPEAVSLPEGNDWAGAGSGFAAYGERLQSRLHSCLGQVLPDCHPHAQDVATLALGVFARGEAVDAEYALPVYLRDRVADTHAASATPL
ncbi:MAG: tRNA (adenosine(37)-N6)-threonylcarbamoyltransferase complex dimerization subunit type 1 TsaB [Chromatiales bacterium]